MLTLTKYIWKYRQIELTPRNRLSKSTQEEEENLNRLQVIPKHGGVSKISTSEKVQKDLLRLFYRKTFIESLEKRKLHF